MARKWTDLEKAIRAGQRELDKLEKKRLRSMAMIFAAQLANEEPNESEVEYFKVYTNLIDLKRREIQLLKDKKASEPKATEEAAEEPKA